jgi:hypothetical protein
VVNTTPRPLYPRKRLGINCIGGWVGPRAGLDGRGKSRPHRDFFFYLYHHVQYTFIMSCWNSCYPLYTPPPGSPFLSRLQVHASHHYHTALGARNVHFFTASIHSPVSRHPTIRTCEIIHGLTDSSLLGSHSRVPIRLPPGPTWKVEVLLR